MYTFMGQGKEHKSVTANRYVLQHLNQILVHDEGEGTPRRRKKLTLVDLQLSRHDLWTYFCVPLQWHGAIKSSPKRIHLKVIMS